MSKIISDHGSPIPLSSLRLIVPPLQLVSAALWEIVKQGAVMYYGLLEEFVTTVLETVPELLTYRERVQLVMGLRARVVLELCRTDEFASPQTIQPHLTRINTYITKRDKETSDSDVKASVTNFFKLVHTLVDDPRQRDVFYQNIFPTVYGPKYDSALQALMRKFLSSLHKLLPVPNLEQTAHWLSLSPSILKECVDFMNQPHPLNTLIQHHKHHGHEVPKALSASGDDCIISSLSYHFQKVDTDKGDTTAESGSMCVPEDWHRHVSLGGESKTDGVENLDEVNSESPRNVAGDGQHVDDLSEDQGASVEVLLPHDENVSSDNELDQKCFHYLQKGSGTSSKSFKCHVCGQGFGSLSKLKRHQISESGCLMNRLGKKHRQSDLSHSTSQSSFFEKINLHPKPKTDVETNVSGRSENDLPSLAETATHNPSTLNTPNFEQSYEDHSLICHVCGKAFTYPKSFDKHQKSCLVKGKRRTDPKCSASLTHSEPRPTDKTEESLPSENETELSVVPPTKISLSSSSEEQTCKRSSRVKTCSVCGEIFTSSNDLTRHMRCHTEQSPYLCSYCGKDFDQYEDCERHQENECRESKQHPQARREFTQEKTSSSTSKKSQESAFSSGSSPQTPSDLDALADSMNASKLPLTCQECGQGFTYHKSFEKHQHRCSQRTGRRRRRRRQNRTQLNRTELNHFVIFACNFQSKDRTLVNSGSSEAKESETASPASSADRSDARLIKCTMCEKNFAHIVDMKKHYSRSHQIRGSYPCPLCKRTFVRLCELVRHQQNKKLYQCSACKKCFTKLTLLNLHEKGHAAKKTPHICETCGRSFKCLAHLILHQKKHRDRDRQPCICSHCGKQFSTKDCLRAHMVRHTGGYPCPICGKKFYQKTYLKWHQYKHTGQNPYLCDTCGKGWPSAAQLKLHMVQHTEERPFKCDDCGACYKRNSHLLAHRRAKHIRVRPFVCEVCSKAFRLNNELRKHMMVHTGERPFVCPRCGKTFTRKSRLREHREKACL